MLKTLTRSIAAVALLGVTVASTTAPAEAYWRHRGVAPGFVAGTILGLGLFGAYAAGREAGYYRRCYPGPRRCRVVGEYCFRDRYGARHCRDDVRCYRARECY